MVRRDAIGGRLARPFLFALSQPLAQRHLGCVIQRHDILTRGVTQPVDRALIEPECVGDLRCSLNAC